MKFEPFMPAVFDECKKPGVSVTPYQPMLCQTRFDTFGDAQAAADIAQWAYAKGVEDGRAEVRALLNKALGRED